jgi:excisionase family DNA binding protein
MENAPKVPDNTGGLMTKKEVAAMLNFSVSTIDTWVSQKREIPFLRIGGRVRFDRRDVEKWLAAKKVNPTNLNS